MSLYNVPANFDFFPSSPSRYGFVGATCPGFDADDVDWRGCNVDAKLISEENDQYSGAWKDALGLK